MTLLDDLTEPEWWRETVERGWSDALPRRTSCAIGGRLRSEVDDFRVDEIPAYEPSGAGVHHYLRLRRRDMTTRYLVGLIEEAFGFERGGRGRDAIGVAGMKDRRAATTQWFSINGEIARAPVEDATRALEANGVDVVEVSRHKNKLKTGHLQGNRFAITVRGATIDAAAIDAAIARLSSRGFPNWFGPQRFGNGRDNVARGLEVLAGRAKARGRFKRLLVSSVQSAVFNATLGLRMETGTVDEVFAGDSLAKVGLKSAFVTADPTADQLRLEAGEIELMGLLPGGGADAGHGPGRALEALAMSGVGAVDGSGGLDERFGTPATVVDMSQVGRLAQGARRAMMVRPRGLRYTLGSEDRETGNDASVVRTAPGSDDCVTFAFELPPGSYATSLLREFLGEGGDLGGHPEPRGTAPT